MGNRVWKGEPSAGGRAGTIIALGIAALVVAGVWFGWTRYWGYSPVSNLSQTFSISFSEDARAIVSKDEESFHGDGYRYVKVAADPEQVDGTILDGRDYSSGQLPPGEHPHNQGSGCDPAIEPGNTARCALRPAS